MEAGLHGRPAAIGPYPVAEELRALGFQWADADDPKTVRVPDPDAVEANREAVRRHLNLHDLPNRLDAVLAEMRL